MDTNKIIAEMDAFSDVSEAIDYVNKQRRLHPNNEDVFDDIVDHYIRKKSGLYTIPDKYQENVYNRAFEAGHSEGALGVYNVLVYLVKIFE